MADTYSQIHIQLVFAVKNREALISENIRQRVEKYITGVVKHQNNKLLAIHCMPDHVHILIGLRPVSSISDLVREIKSESSAYINKEHLALGKFAWQEGYGAFSYSKSHVDQVINYILTQPEHHRKKTFKEEYLNFLQKFEIDFEEKYLFDWIG